MRTEKELWELVLNRTDLFETGLCKWLKDLLERGTITVLEFLLLDDTLIKNLPQFSEFGYYCWKPFQIEPRIEWIKNRIKQLENGEL